MTARGGSKLTRKMETAVAALLVAPTHALAAAAAGVSESTLSRWLHLPGFRRAWLDARRRAVEQAVVQVQQAAGEAVQALRRNLTSGSPGTEVRAALGLLDHAIKGVELLDLAERLDEVERQLGDEDEPQGDGEEAGGDGGAGGGDRGDAGDRGAGEALPGGDG